MLLPTSGNAKINGLDVVKDVWAVRKQIGLCTAASRFFWDFSADQILNYYAMLHGLDGEKKKKRIEHVVEFFEISDFRQMRFTELSTGMKQKIALAKSLINDPIVWFLDEPTNGLDVEISRDVRKKIKQLVKEKEITVLLTSHYLSEVEELCDRIAVINKGKIITIGGIKQVKEGINFFDTITFRIDKALDVSFIEKLKGVELVRTKDKNVLVRARAPQHVVGQIIEEIEKRQGKLHDLEIKRASLEDVFLKLVKR